MTNFENYLSKVIYMELKTLERSGALDFSNYQHSIKKIYIDMDGVLVDFENGIKNIIPTFGKLTKSLDSNEMWKAVEKKKNFWETLKPLPNAKELIALLKRKFKSAEFYILTGVPSDEKKLSKELEEKDKEIGFINSASKDGKKKWIKKNFSEFNNKIIFVRRIQKQEYSQEGCLLIDDNLETCEEWNIKEGAGIWYNHKNQNFDAIKKTIESFKHTEEYKNFKVFDKNKTSMNKIIKNLEGTSVYKTSQKTFTKGYHDISLDVSKKNSKYIGVVLDSKSKRSIKIYIKKYIKKTLGLNFQKWKISGDHITIALTKKELSESGINSESIEPLKYSGQLDAIGYLPNKENPELIAFRVETKDNRTIKFENKQKAKVKANVAHVTFGCTGEQEPKNSGSITVWDKLIEPINISGVLTEV